MYFCKGTIEGRAIGLLYRISGYRKVLSSDSTVLYIETIEDNAEQHAASAAVEGSASWAAVLARLRL